MIKKVVGILVVIIVLLGIYLVLKPKPAPSPKPSMKQTSQVIKLALNVKNNKLTNSTNKFTFTQGETLEITVTSDIDGEIHFHGYDKHLEAKKGQPIKLEFVLDTAGNFPFELEETSTELGTLIVNPK